MHKPECRSNEFADAVEEKEPKFAAWLRQHGKQAVLKDEEVDRLERAVAAVAEVVGRDGAGGSQGGGGEQGGCAA